MAELKKKRRNLRLKFYLEILLTTKYINNKIAIKNRNANTNFITLFDNIVNKDLVGLNLFLFDKIYIYQYFIIFNIIG